MVLESLIKIYKNLFPKNALIIVFAPLIIGFLIAPELVETRDILVNFIWVNIVFIGARYLKSNALYNFFLSLYFVFGIIEIGHWLIVKGPVTITSLLVASNTNLEESLGFFDIKGSWGLLVFIPYTIIFYFGIKKKLNRDSFCTCKKPALIMFSFSLIFVLENAYNQRLIRKGVPQLPKTISSFINKRNLYKEALGKKKDNLVEAESRLKDSKQTCVLILGESCSRNHMSLYGYHRNTNPLLKKRDDIEVYDNVVSPHSNTINSILSILSESNLDNKKPFEESIDFFDVFHAAKFKSYWLSNQSPIGIWDNLITVFANKADVKQFVNLSSNSSFESTLKSSYDEKLMKPFLEVLNQSEDKKIIVLHLMGNHSKYSKRYPSEYDVFSGEDKKTDVIAEYDNSILYNDYLVNVFLDEINAYSKENPNEYISAIYLSDHGENVYDFNNGLGHDYSQTIPKVNVEIPFLIWRSKNYNQDYNKKKAVYNSTAYVTDDLFHSLIDLNAIKTDVFDETRSLFNVNYNSDRARVLEDNMNYDSK